MNRLSRVCVAAVLLAGVLCVAGAADAKRGPSVVVVCVDSSSGVVSRTSPNSACVGRSQSWSSSQPAPLLCWDASSVARLDRTRLVSVAPVSGCVEPLQLVPVGKVVVLCADKVSGVLRWPVTGVCDLGNQPTWVRAAAQNVATSTTTTTSTTPTTVAVTPSVSLTATKIGDGTWPRAVTVTANVAGTVYFAEGDFVVKTVSDITSAQQNRWAKGTVLLPNTPTTIAIDVDAVSNGYFRVYIANSQGVLSAPAINILTISITRAAELSTTTTTAAIRVRTQTLDQDYATFSGDWSAVVVSFTQPIGQSFTAGLSGPLSRVSCGVFKTGPLLNLTASLYLADHSGNVTGAVLASTTIDTSAVPSRGLVLTNFDFATPYSVVAGTKYVIVLETQSIMSFNFYSWVEEKTNSNTGGAGIVYPLTGPLPLRDYVLQTYVDL